MMPDGLFEVVCRSRSIGRLLFACSILLGCLPVASAQETSPTSSSAPARIEAEAGVIAYDGFDYTSGLLRNADGGSGWKRPWRTARQAVPEVIEAFSESATRWQRAVEFHGAGTRNNPLRRELATPLSQAEIFVRFELRYNSQASPATDPEFFVLWLDRLDGVDAASHTNNTPNIGVHVADSGELKGRTVFMARIGTQSTAYTEVELESGQAYQVVARLAKSDASPEGVFDELDLWVNPTSDERETPQAKVRSPKGHNSVRWVGFTTANKTETTDRIGVANLLISSDWHVAINPELPSANDESARGYNGVVWDQPVDFAKDVYPVLKSRCFDCHEGEQPYAGLRLDVHRELLGYSSGNVLAEPGRSHDSRLMAAITAEAEEDRMPPDGDEPLTDEQIAMLQAWIDQGMHWDEELLPTPRRESDHWAFQPIVTPEIPACEDAAWIRTPVDAFIAQAQRSAGVRHAGEASKRTLVRRLYLDLLGLPPTPEEVEAFLQDSSPDAYERLVEKLLDSPHYGERWARYWLDLARWAESQGYQHDIVRPNAWRYRDYVIESFNKDKPYDRFLKEQLAGDELEPYSDENLIATGFLGAARISGNQEDEAIQRNDVLVDIVNATGSAILGLTMECAQCHNHKFDPISQRDYYSLQGFFVRGQLGNLSLQSEDTSRPANMSRWIPGDGLDFYKKEVKSLTNKKLYKSPTKPTTWGFLSAATGHSSIERFPVVNRKPIAWQPELLKTMEPRMLVRGDTGTPGNAVTAAWPEVLGITPTDLGERRRSALADWMADPQNPLVSRVWVNRLWQYHFGRGIVSTSGDFGVEGMPPSHPELLDWLSTELMKSGWSTKHIHRLIVLSATYRQQCAHNAANAELDPENKLLWQWPRRRMEAEAIRDSALVASGELNRAIGGISVPPEHEETRLRRTLYSFQKRSDMPTVMEMFDGPKVIASCSRRAVSTVPLQPLYMLNSPFMANRAKAIAQEIERLAGEDSEAQIKLAFQRVLSRPPESEEIALAQDILCAEQEVAADLDFEESENKPDQRLVQLCHALMNLNEFVYIE